MLVPLLVDKDNVGPSGLKAIQSMMVRAHTTFPCPPLSPPFSRLPHARLCQLAGQALAPDITLCSWVVRRWLWHAVIACRCILVVVTNDALLCSSLL